MSSSTVSSVGISRPGINDPMTIDWWRTDKLWQAPKSARRYTAKDIKKAERILKRWGVRLPLVITSDGCVIAHFIAVIAARKAGHRSAAHSLRGRPSGPRASGLIAGARPLL